MSRYVLVHGAWHGAWCWHKVVAELERRGHSVEAVDLPGHGLDRTPLEQVSLDAYSDRVVATLESADEPAVLVGHSMGGLVITEAAERVPQLVSQLVYLCAFLVPAGVHPQAVNGMEGSEVPTVLIPSEDPQSTTVDPAGLERVFYGDCSAEDIALARALLVPQKMSLFGSGLSHTEGSWGTVARHYVVCTQDRAITEAAQRAMIAGAPCQKVTTLETSHSPFFSAPGELADALEA